MGSNAVDHFVFYPHPTDLSLTTSRATRSLVALLRESLERRENASFASHFDAAECVFYKVCAPDIGLYGLATDSSSPMTYPWPLVLLCSSVLASGCVDIAKTRHV